MADIDSSKVSNVNVNTKKPKTFNLLASMATSQTPVFESLIVQICNDFPEVNHKKEEMLNKYIYKNDKVWKRMVNKFKPKNSRSKSGYTIYLSDPLMIKKIKRESNGKMMKELNPNKGLRWKKIKTETPELYQRYCNVAKLINHKIITFDEDDQNEMRKTIETWVHNKTSDDLNKLLSQVKESVKKPRKNKIK